MTKRIGFDCKWIDSQDQVNVINNKDDEKIDNIDYDYMNMMNMNNLNNMVFYFRLNLYLYII